MLNSSNDNNQFSIAGFSEELANTFNAAKENILDKYPQICERIVPISDIGIEPRVFFHWKEKGIVDWHSTSKSQKQRIKLDLYDSIWVKIVFYLREIGVSISDIKDLKNQLHTNALSLLKEIDPDTISVLKTHMAPEQFNLIIETIEQHKKLSSEFGEITSSVNTLLGMYLSNILLNGTNIKLLLVKNFGKLRAIPVDYEYSEMNKRDIEMAENMTHIKVPLYNILLEFIEMEKNEKHLEKFGLLSHQEKEILEAIRNKEIREINIKRDQHEGITLTTSKDGELPENLIFQLKKYMIQDETSEFRIVKRNDKHLYIESKNKKKL